MKAAIFTVACLMGLACAAPTEKRWPSKANLITPSTLSQYYVSSGKIDYKRADGKVAKPSSAGDMTTLITFSMPTESNGKTCSLGFYLDYSTSSLSGSKLLDVYTSNAPAPGARASWGPGNQRNLPYGRFELTGYRDATWKADVAHPGSSFPCPKGEAGFEVVGVYDNDSVEWSGAVSGLYLTWA
ncbi:hypothetical protein EJ04DRAFT_506687 [Polyplosphaeria fusca]|uniref:Ubiquitin 3 binding protein But2 C-terminal domain-containing protein n=1 Tax=Polyplosphaeria fusca TaxID=682080 RepID=A0A9P4UVF3_9PLEO|nr:hypothetical protein EJ04DRAFT_506687 [Polyplosphaeria fusca]